MTTKIASVTAQSDAEELYRRMALIRAAELRLEEDILSGLSPGQVHSSRGQEAVAVGVMMVKAQGDKLVSSHRGHGHFLAAGGDLEGLFAEIYGRRSGVCGGMGGSMHLAQLDKGILGCNGIVGAGLPIATGTALAQKLDGGHAITLCFFGDGAANQGVLSESLNIAKLWSLPILFVLEDNGYSEFSTGESQTAGRVADRALAFSMPVEEVDGNDVFTVRDTAQALVAPIRSGNGPAFLAARTYRQSGHFAAEAAVMPKPYRSRDEEERWALRDPLRLLAAQIETAATLDDNAATEVAAAAQKAAAQVETNADDLCKLLGRYG